MPPSPPANLKGDRPRGPPGNRDAIAGFLVEVGPIEGLAKLFGRPCNMAWFVSNSPLAAAGLRQEPGTSIKVFRTEAEAVDFVRKLRAAKGSSGTSPYVEYRRGGRTLVVIRPDEIDGWIKDTPTP